MHMAITSVLDEIKLSLKFTKGSQTLSHCNPAATNDQLHTLGKAVASLNAESLDTMMKVEETKLLLQG